MKLANTHALSLVEILVTIIIFAILVGALYAVLRTGGISWKTYENNISVQREARNALSKMVRELREASNISITQSSGNATISFLRSGVGTVTYTWSDSGDDAGRIIRTLSAASSGIANDISALSLIDNTTSITITITATSSMFGGQESSITLKEKVTLRN